MKTLANAAATTLALLIAVVILATCEPLKAPVRPGLRSSETVQHTDGCAIRLLSTGPVLLRDSAHHCSDDFTDVFVDSNGDLDLTYHVQGKIVTVLVNPDETLAKRDVEVGASVGLEHMIIAFGRDQVHHSALSAVVTGSSSNIWIWVVTEEEIVTPSPTPSGS